MINLDALKKTLSDDNAQAIQQAFIEAVETKLNNQYHGDLARWMEAVETLPNQTDPLAHCLTDSAISVGHKDLLGAEDQELLVNALKGLKPWRKGPFSLFGEYIDTEWRSDWKWDRLIKHISPLKNRRVLDIGCGNGYHCWRMKGAGARFVIGVDPNPLFTCQFNALQKYIQDPDVHMLPIGLEELPSKSHFFDSVFSMGVLYHRRSPMEYLKALHDQLRPGGELVLETLVIDGDETAVLVPDGRYARMRNVWFIPSSQALALWLRRCGFSDVKIIDETPTDLQEQRTTQWMEYESLAQSLDSENPKLTVEGHPAPLRAVLIATRQ